MEMKLKNKLKKMMAEALTVGLLVIPAILHPAGVGEGSLPGEVTAGSEQSGTCNGGEEDSIMPCGDLGDEDIQEINS